MRPKIRTSFSLRVAVVLTALIVGWFYLWTVKTAAARLELTGQKNDYYNLLVDGFLDGHLYMKMDPDPRLLALPPERRPGDAPFKLDASLYAGRYYLYFGVVPVVALYVPYALLTGHDLSEALAAVIFMFAAFCVASAWWWEVRRRFFPDLRGVWVVLGVVALGFCTAAPSALRRPLFYEVAIGAGYLFSMVALWAVTRAWWRPGRVRTWWLMVAGVAVGLAIGSRANLAPAGLLFLVAGAGGLAAKIRSGQRGRRFAVLLLAAGVGAGAVGAGLAGYNYARFGNPVEFGHHYQLGLNPKRMFRAENFRHNLGVYYLIPPVVNGYFPFISPGDEGAKPDDYIGREEAHGEWPWTLVVGLAAVTAMALAERRRGEGWPAWTGAVMLALVLFGVNFVVVALTGVRANRYMLDFHPALVLATLIVLAAGLISRSRWGRLLGVGVLVLVPAATGFNVLGSLQVHGFLQTISPDAYGRIAAAADRLVWPLLAGEAAAVGDREVSWRWPTGNRGWRREPVLLAGAQDFRDIVFVDYNGLGRARIAYLHGAFGEVTGEWFEYVGGARVSVVVSGALLLPAASHPWYGRRAAEERLALKRRLRVLVDGVLRLDRDVISYDSSPRLQTWGEWHRADGKVLSFTGELGGVAAKPVDDAWLRRRVEGSGALALTLMLPSDRFGATEPLLQQGGADAFDALAVEYLRPGFVRLLHDQKGGGGRWSEPFAVDYAQLQAVEIDLPIASDGSVWRAINPGEAAARPGLMRVRWNGREVFQPDLPVLPASGLSLALGVNAAGASAVSAFFGGQLSEVPRSKPLTGLGPGEWIGRWEGGHDASGDRGVWLRLERANGALAALVWQRERTGGDLRFYWIESGRGVALATLAPAETEGLTVRLHASPSAGAVKSEPAVWIELETKTRGVFAVKSEFLATPITKAWSPNPAAWTGSALGRGEAPVAAAGELPGRIKLRFKLPSGGFTGGDPLLSAGPAGKADSVYLKGLGGGRYVLGVDHWGFGSVESAAFTLEPEAVHTLVVELGSLVEQGELAKDRARLVLDGKVVLDAVQALYPVKTEEIFYGLNPHGMSTSAAVFRGGIISMRERVGPDDLR